MVNEFESGKIKQSGMRGTELLILLYFAGEGEGE
jgi:hypothetical protein